MEAQGFNLTLKLKWDFSHLFFSSSEGFIAKRQKVIKFADRYINKNCDSDLIALVYGMFLQLSHLNELKLRKYYA